MNNDIKYLGNEFFADHVKKNKSRLNLKIYAKFLAVFGGLYLYLYLKRPFKEYRIIHVSDDAQLEKVYQFRYEIYCITDKLLNAADYPNKCETDAYDKYSSHFAVLNGNNQVVGVFRLIKYSNLGFPTEQEFHLNPLIESTAKTTVEISRLMVRREYRKTMLLLDILRTIYQYSRKESIGYWYGCAEPWFIRTLNKIVGPLKILDKPQQCFNAINYPFHLKVNDLEDNVKTKSRLIFEYFKYHSKNIVL